MASPGDIDTGPVSGEQPGLSGDVEKRSGVLGLLFKGLGQLTAREQQAVLLVVILGLLGIGVKLWHSWHGG